MTKKKSQNQSIVVQSAILAAAQILVRVIGLFYRVPLQRIMGTEAMGIYGYAYEIYQFLLLLSANGIPVAVSLLVSKYLAKREYKNVYNIFKGSMVFALIMGGAISLFTLFGARGLATLFFKENVTLALRVLAPTIFISAVMGVYRGYFQGKNAMMPTAISQLVEQIFNAVVSVAAAYILIVKGPAYGAAGSTLGTCIGALSGLIFVAIVYYLYKPTLMRLVKKDSSKRLLTANQVLKMVGMTMAPIVLSSTIYQISGIIDSSMFSKITSTLGYAEKVTDELFGNYSGQYKLVWNIPLGITSSIGIALIPAITKLVVLDRLKEAREKIDSTLKLTNLIAIPCAIGLIVLADPIMKLLFKIDNDVPIRLLQLGAVTVITYSFSTVTIAILQGVNRMKVPVINSAISIGIHIVFVYILLRFADLNIYALVYGNLVFSVCMCILNLYSMYKYIGYKQEVLKSFLLPLGASLIMGAIAFFVYKGVYFVVHSNLISIIFSVVFAVASYGIGVVLLGAMDEEELRSLPKGYLLVKLLRKMHIM